MESNKLIVADIGWAETIPDWLKKEVESERMLSGFASVMDKGEESVGDAEACLYLYTLSLKQNMGNYSNIYLYLASKLMKNRNTEVPKDIQVTKLTVDETRLLKDLKHELYKKRGGEIKSPLFNILKEMKKRRK